MLVTTIAVATASYQAITKVFVNSRPQVLQAEIIENPTDTPTPIPTSTSTPTPSPTSTPRPTLSEPDASPSRRPTSTLTPTFTPTPTTPPPPPATSEQIQGFIERFAGQYGVDANVLRYIGVCESGLNPLAVNGPYAGIYQFSSSAWINNRKLLGEDTNPDLRFNAEESVQTAAYLLSVGKGYLWPNCLP